MTKRSSVLLCSCLGIIALGAAIRSQDLEAAPPTQHTNGRVELPSRPSTATSGQHCPKRIRELQVEVDTVGDSGRPVPTPQKVLQDTMWIASWSFDSFGTCDFSGWTRMDNRTLNDGTVFWDLDNSFDGIGNVIGWAAALNYQDDACCVNPYGYANDWYQGIRIEYDDTAPVAISFDYELGSEPAYDFLQIEVDSACASFERVDFITAPESPAAAYRQVLYSSSGYTSGGSVAGLPLTQFGAGTSCVYVGFVSDDCGSPCDGTVAGLGMVVDNIVLDEDGGLTSEDFEDQTLSHGWTFVNMQDSTPFGPVSRNGSWARVYPHITDNEACLENTSCAVLWTDDTTSTPAVPRMAFAPGGFVVKNWLDDIIVSPWVDLSATPDAAGTIIQFRSFPGNFFINSLITQNWSVRSKFAMDDGMGGTLACVSEWGHADEWSFLGSFGWLTLSWDMSADVVVPAESIQVRLRLSDWQKIAGAPFPSEPWNPGPGPYVDDVRIGRMTLSGDPVLDEGIDARSQAQDSYPTEIHPGVTPGTGEHHRPTLNRYGVTAFSRGEELGINYASSNIITGDSITIRAPDVPAELTRLDLLGAIVSGPHVGQAPPPYVVGSNGFFEAPAFQCLDRLSIPQPGCGVGCVPNPGVTFIDDWYYVDLDDEYFVGGDVLYYVWIAEDANGGFSSVPSGLSAVPAGVAEAEEATNGLFEVSFLPAINWDQDYLAAVAANNKVNPHSDPSYLDGSKQRNCVLYVNRINARRRSGDLNRTSFMYTLDRLGYRDSYDVYDHTGMGNTNNHLGSRASVQQAQGYNLIVYDAGDTPPNGTIMPDGSDLDYAKVDQAGWFRVWLGQAMFSEARFATLWVIGSNVLEEHATNPLYTTNMQVTLASTDALSGEFNPDAVAQLGFAFRRDSGSAVVDYTQGSKSRYSLSSGCGVTDGEQSPIAYRNIKLRHYDGLNATGAGVEVFAYEDRLGFLGDAAVVMGANVAENYNTIMMSHPWFDVRNDEEPPSSFESEEDFLRSTLTAVVGACSVEQLAAATSSHGATAPNGVGQTFTACGGGVIKAIAIDVAALFIPNMTLELQETADTWDPSYSQDVTLTLGWQLIVLSTPFKVDAGASYSFALFPSSSGSVSLNSSPDPMPNESAFLVTGSSVGGIGGSPDVRFEVPIFCEQPVDPTDTADQLELTVPSRTSLHQNAPNPFNPVTTIRFDLAQSGFVSLRIYDVSGRLVRTLANQRMGAARHVERVWDGRDDLGQPVPSGMYFYRLEAPSFVATKKMVLVQ